MPGGTPVKSPIHVAEPLGRDRAGSPSAKEARPQNLSMPPSTLKYDTSGGGGRFSGRMMLRIGQEAATVPLLKQGRLPCPRATAT